MSSFLRPLYKAGNKFIHYKSVPLLSESMAEDNIQIFHGKDDADKFKGENGNQLCPQNIKVRCIIQLCPTSKLRTKTERTNITPRASFTADSQSFESAVLWILNKDGLSSIPISQWKVGYVPHPKADTTTIYDYNLNDIEWDQFEYLTLTQKDPEISSTPTMTPTPSLHNKTRGSNKSVYDEQAAALNLADSKLKKMLSAKDYNKLRQNNRAYVAAKFDVVRMIIRSMSV